MPFVDTNIFLYRISTDPAEANKQAIAAGILEADDLFVSVQVFQEFYTQATRPLRPDALLHDEAMALIESWKRFSIQEITVKLLDAALAARERWQLSYWDAAIIEAARLSNCETVLSEDLNPHHNFGGVKVVNPFA
jgi:predicted nucleic acid-binding protein